MLKNESTYAYFPSISLQDSPKDYNEDIHPEMDFEYDQYIASTQEILETIKSMKQDRRIIRIVGLDIEKFTESQRLVICITRREHTKFLESLKTIAHIKENAKIREIEYISLHINDFISQRLVRKKQRKSREDDIFVISLYNEIASKAQEILKP